MPHPQPMALPLICLKTSIAHTILHMAIYNKMTIVPLRYFSRLRPLVLPIGLGVDLTVESVDGLLKPELFELWREYVPTKETQALSSAEVGIVHRFSSKDHVGMNEAASQEKVNHAFAFLRLIRPTRDRFSQIQLKLEDNRTEVVSFTQPALQIPNCPYLQLFNTFHQEHLEKFVRTLPKFLGYISSPAVRAPIRYFEECYWQISDPLLQFITWMIGIESFFARDERPVPQSELINRIMAIMGKTNIYSDVEIEVFPSKPKAIAVEEILPDMFKLRDRAVHGSRVREFEERTTISAATQGMVSYIEELREAASFVLRNLVLDAIEKTNV